MRKRFVSWAAVSSLPQAKKVSLEDQRKANLDCIAKHDGILVADLVVRGESRNIVLMEDARERIDAYKQLFDLIKSKSFDVLIFLDRSRLGRTAALSMAIAELCNRAHILLYETMAPLPSLDFRPADHSDLLIGAIKSVDAQQEVRKIVDRHRKGMADRVNKGRMPGKVNWGYLPTYEAGKLSGYTIDEDAATTIRLIVSLYLDNGFGALNIADHLNRQGLPAPAGGMWGHTQITFLLRRIWRYAGFAELNVHSKTGRPYVRAAGQWPAIISEETARRVIAEREARNSTRRSVHTVYRFTRMVVCGVCGSRLHASTKYRAWTRADGTPGRYAGVYYRCPGDHVLIVENKIMAFMRTFMEDFTNRPAARAAWLNQPTVDQSAEIVASIDRLNAHIDKLNAGIAKADIDHYSHGALADDAPRYQAIVSALKKQIATAQGEITTLQDQLHEEERAGQRSARIDDIRANGLACLSSTDVRSANAWLRDRFAIVIDRGPKRGCIVKRIIPLF